MAGKSIYGRKLTREKEIAISVVRAIAVKAQEAYLAALADLREELGVTAEQDQKNSIEGTMERGDMCLENLPLSEWAVDDLVQWAAEARGEAV